MCEPLCQSNYRSTKTGIGFTVNCQIWWESHYLWSHIKIYKTNIPLPHSHLYCSEYIQITENKTQCQLIYPTANTANIVLAFISPISVDKILVLVSLIRVWTVLLEIDIWFILAICCLPIAYSVAFSKQGLIRSSPIVYGFFIDSNAICNSVQSSEAWYVCVL